MPIYEYQCQQCGHNTELLQKISDEPATQCPSCHQPSLKKMVSAAGFQLKGTGWYVTDFRDKNKPQKGSDNTSADSAASTSKADNKASNSSDS